MTLREADGSSHSGLSNDPAFFPLGVWLENVHESGIPGDTAAGRLSELQAAGTNLLVTITTDSNLDAVEASGMYFLSQANEPTFTGNSDHPAIDGWFVSDEAGIMYGPGSDPWSGVEGWNTCIPIQDQDGQCGYTVIQQFESLVPDGELRYANYGLGVLEWESDQEAAGFVNGGFQDIVSADRYWFTHPGSTPAERKGANYGAEVEQVRYLDGLAAGTASIDRQPVWAVIELGHPFTEDDASTITPTQMRSATWHSIIAGARGIMYFNHSFGGPCVTFSIIREHPCASDVATVDAVTRLNAQITELAPVLNAPFADGYVSAKGSAKVMAKLGPDGAWYVFAGADTAGNAGGDVAFSIADGSAVKVLFENRNLTVRDGQFVDTFANGDAVHIYR